MEEVRTLKQATIGISHSLSSKALSLRTWLQLGARVGFARFGDEQDKVDVIETPRSSEIAAGYVAGFGCPLGDSSTTRAESGARVVRRLQEIEEFDGG